MAGRVVVLGAGVIGASLALRLAQAGMAVTVLEARRVGAGTSGSSFAWTNANTKRPRTYFDLNVAGMRAHRALADEFGATPWWRPGGNLEWADREGEAELRARVGELQGWGYAAEWLAPGALAELEPDIDPAAVGDAAVVLFPDEGMLDPVVYAHAMLREARRLGAALHTRGRVLRVETRGGRVTGVLTEDGAHHPADVVVNCLGRWVNDVAVEPGLHLPMASTPGLLVLTPPVPTGLRRVVHAPTVNLRPEGAGRLLLQWEGGDIGLDPDRPPAPDSPAVREVLRRAEAVLPDTAPLEAESARIGVRPIPADGHSAFGPAPRLAGYWFAVTHSGATLAPFAGLALADEIAHGRERPELAAFRPARFFN